MNSTTCASFDLKAYQFGEATVEERRAVELHAKACGVCHEELTRLDFTRAALLTVRDEEIPRRIAFVSDKVFEPKWYQRWFATPSWGFASAGVLAAAIVFHGATRPAPVAQIVQQAPVQAATTTVDTAAIVKQAVAEADARSEKRARLLLAEAEKRHELDRAEMMATVNASFSELSKRFNNAVKMTASADYGR